MRSRREHIGSVRQLGLQKKFRRRGEASRKGESGRRRGTGRQTVRGGEGIESGGRAIVRKVLRNERRADRIGQRNAILLATALIGNKKPEAILQYWSAKCSAGLIALVRRVRKHRRGAG